MPGAGEDVLVVGGGPAGLACAIAAAMRGMRVRVVDAAREGPVDKACGEGLLPDALECLAGLGVRVSGGRRLAGIRFLSSGRVAEARFSSGFGLGLRRLALHRAMLERVEELGVRVEWGTPVRELGGLDGRFVVGADGGQSRVRTLAGVEDAVTTRRVGLRQHYGVKPWSEFVEVYWGASGQAYVTPVSEDEVGVALLSTRKFASMEEGLAWFPGLRARLQGAAARSASRGALSVTRRLGRVTRGSVALVGDASGAVDAITGEGLALAFRQAGALAEAMVAGDLRVYEEAHRKMMRMPRVMSAALLWMDRSAMVRRGAMGALTVVPGVFEGLLNLHAGAGREHLPQLLRAPCAVP